MLKKLKILFLISLLLVTNFIAFTVCGNVCSIINLKDDDNLDGDLYKVKIVGDVDNKKNGEPIQNALVQIPEVGLKGIALTDIEGHYEISFKVKEIKNSYEIKASKFGYTTDEVPVNIKQNRWYKDRYDGINNFTLDPLVKNKFKIKKLELFSSLFAFNLFEKLL
jgi:hypothetical protein